ncbi:putative umta methyltransferase family protein [Botrytis fragariae]|uniref:Putative umta methyltransferase family protein n=1 Tax=Botrytis fragariae TaxID=1964551 RepID=A0A8H6AID2_9HELO|nr:putative umta methyltransferase family protein [Botrytis fragariae]KAF5867778.1 putative umta methyltransferase family protein [Botrytis fragariae]
MTSAAEKEYVLERSPLGSSRLYVQHWLWQRLVGHLLHPSIPIKQDIKIADIACGTGIWLIDLAKELAKSETNAQLVGFDISTNQYPHSALLPPNVKLDIMDIFKPVPERLRGQYDVVHISLLCVVIPGGDPRYVLDNVLTLLKPGGYIQWKEVDFSMMACKAATPDLSTSHLEELMRWMYEVPLKKFTSFEWIRQLSSIFQERGITVLDGQLLEPEAYIACVWTSMHMNGIKELVNVAGEGSRDVLELYGQAAQEVQEGAYISMMLVNVVGRKAGDD